MLYTLGIVFGWFVLAFVLGAILGWVVHHVVRCSSVRHGAKSASTPAAPSVTASTAAASVELADSRAELKELRARVSRLEPAALERDTLRNELVDLRASRAPEWSAPARIPAQPTQATDQHAALRADRERLSKLVHRHEATIGVQAATIHRLQSHLDSVSVSAPPSPDLDGGAAVLGRPIMLNDLTVIKGIDTDIQALCHREEITTWWSLANTDAAVLRLMLERAGGRVQMRDPSSWPEQARLLAHGSWQQFRKLTASSPSSRRGD